MQYKLQDVTEAAELQRGIPPVKWGTWHGFFPDTWTFRLILSRTV